MQFLAPWLLLGGLGVAVPIILHFFYKARYRPLPWAAMRFLKQAIEQTSRRLRFQELVLLALRCLALLLLALALARPSCSQFNIGGRGESVDAVLLFDTSLSMGASDGDKTRIERAKQAALTVLDNLPPNSTVQMFSVADRVKLLGPRNPNNLDQARQLVEGLSISSLAGEALPAMTQALEAIESGSGTNKEIYFFSDFQKTGWDSQAAALRERAEDLKRRAAVILVRCGNLERNIGNVAITDLTYPGQIPHTDPARPTRLPVTIVLKNTSKVPVRNLSVTLEVDGKVQDQESSTVELINPEEYFPVTLTARFDQPGTRLLTARISGDDLPGDNRLDRVLEVRSQLRVLVVDGTPDLRDPKQSGSHFVRNALVPVSADQVNEYYVRLTTVSPEEAGPGLLAVNDVCILCNVASSNADRPGIAGLSKDFVDQLKSFVERGGGLLIGVGDNLVSQRYNAVLGSGGVNLLPFDLLEPKTLPADQPITPAPDSADPNSFLSRYQDEPFRSVVSAVEVRRYVPVTEAERGGRVLMRLSFQAPWISSKTIGEGEVIFVGTSLDESWTNWPAKAGAYLTFFQFAVAQLANRQQRELNRAAGDLLTWPAPERGLKYDLVSPTGQRSLLSFPPQDAPKPNQLTVTDTTVAGPYRIGLVGEDPPSAALFAVTPILRDSQNLTLLTDAEIEEILGFKPSIVLAGSESQTTFLNERNRREWTVWVLLLLFGIAITECIWAWFCGKAW